MHPDGKHIFKHYFLAFSVQNIIKNILEKYRSDKSHSVSTKGPILYFIEGKFPSEDINSEEKICICCSLIWVNVPMSHNTAF